MKKILITFLTATIVLTSCGGGYEEPLYESIENTVDEAELSEVIEVEIFQSKDGKFKINFSGEPAISSEIIPTEVGNIEMSTFMYEKSVTEAYMVAYNDYPSEMIKNSSIDDLLDGAKNGSSSSMGITTFDLEKNIEIEGSPGRWFKGNNGNYYVEYKLFLTGNRLYQIAIIRDGSYTTQERTEEFFGSFELLKEEE